ncbi:hypothetical protein ACFSUS_18335 [Spirosoma soli]|uniref:T9SS type A sorting domain-containing protein n=1 Tax=Spirosoma soli TaxID=1770529 RepID=A0ABW5M7F7_9BACT
MKILVKSLFLAIALIAAFSAIVIMTAGAAQGRPTNPTAPTAVRSAVFPSAAGKAVNVVIEKPAGQTLVVRMVDKQNHLLFTQTISKNVTSHRTKFNVEELTDGNYEIELVNGQEVSRHSFTLSTLPQVSRTISMEQ